MRLSTPARLLALTPIEDEFDAMRSALETLGLSSSEKTIGSMTGISFRDGALIVARGGLGKAQFGIQAQHALERLGDRDLLVCAGTSGGLAPALAIGDVVVATETVEHDFRWGMKDKPAPRFPGWELGIAELRRSSQLAEMPFGVHFGAVASGDEGIADQNRARELYEDTGALAVAWEGAGGARAAQFSGVPFLEIRGISDGAGSDAPGEFERNLPHAVGNVAQVILDLASVLG